VTDLTIRPATDADGDGLAVLISGCFAEYEGCLFDRAAEFPELDAIATHFQDKDGAIWVAEHEARIVGSIASTPTEEADTVELFKLYVAREMRGQGLARALLEHVLGFARERNAGAVRLFTDTRFLDAHRFYERNGFRRLPGSRPLHDISNSFEYPYRLSLSGEH
jgi:putative acetyltransferase